MSAPVRPSSCPPAVVEAVRREVERHNDYGQWASQLHDGWGDAAAVTVLIENIIRLADQMRDPIAWHDVTPDEPCELCDGTGWVVVPPAQMSKAALQAGALYEERRCPRECVPVEPGATR